MQANDLSANSVGSLSHRERGGVRGYGLSIEPNTALLPLVPSPRGERADRSSNKKGWVRGFGTVSTAGNPLTPPLPHKRGREPTEFAARVCSSSRHAKRPFVMPRITPPRS